MFLCTFTYVALYTVSLYTWFLFFINVVCLCTYTFSITILGAGLGFGFPGLTLGFGVGAGCGIGIGFGYGMGKGIAYDERKRYSNVGKMFQDAPHLPTWVYCRKFLMVYCRHRKCFSSWYYLILQHIIITLDDQMPCTIKNWSLHISF